LAIVYVHQGKYEQAEPLLQRALTIYKELLGVSHPNVAYSSSNLAELYLEQG
jgi:tetratricopeptide (TPR) repeat protein